MQKLELALTIVNTKRRIKM